VTAENGLGRLGHLPALAAGPVRLRCLQDLPVTITRQEAPTMRNLIHRPRREPPPAIALKTVAIGAFALGAFAVGALAIGALAIGRLSVGRARIKSLTVDDLTVRNLTIVERSPPPSDKS